MKGDAIVRTGLAAGSPSPEPTGHERVCASDDVDLAAWGSRVGSIGRRRSRQAAALRSFRQGGCWRGLANSRNIQ